MACSESVSSLILMAELILTELILKICYLYSYHHFGKKRALSNYRLHPTSIQLTVDLHNIVFHANCLAAQNPSLSKSRFHLEKTNASCPHHHTTRSTRKTVVQLLTCLTLSTLHQSVQWPSQCSSVDSNLEPRATFYTLGSEYTHACRTESVTETLSGVNTELVQKSSDSVFRWSIKSDLMEITSKHKTHSPESRKRWISLCFIAAEIRLVRSSP